MEVGDFNVVAEDASEEQLMHKFIHEYGPMSVAVDANAWQLYFGGVMKASQCSKNLDRI